MKNWIDVATWREDEKNKQDEENKLREGIQNFRVSGFQARDFFNVDARDARRQEQKRMKEEKAKEMEEKEQRRLEKRRQEEDEERRKEKQEEEEEEQEQSQTLFEIHREIGKREQVTGHTMRRENAIGFPCKLKKK